MSQNNSPRVSRRAFLRLGASGLAAVALASCQQSPTPAPTVPPTAKPAVPPTAPPAVPTVTPPPAKKKGGRLVFAAHSEPYTLDVHKSTQTIDDQFGLNVYESLVFHNVETGKFLPYLAESWETSPDGLTWTFKVRKGVVFHDGTPLDGKAVQRNFQRIVDPKTAAGTAATLIGAKLLTKVEAVDDSTVRLVYSKPFAPLLAGLSQSFTGIISPAALDKYGGDMTSNAVGTGPFKFKEWVPKKQVTLVRNDQYNWAPAYFTHQGPPLVDELQWLGISETTTRLVAFEKGESHLTYAALSEYQKLKASGFNVVQAPVPGMGPALYMNISKPPLNDLKVRQAIAHAIDREGMLSAPFLGGATIAEYGPLSSVTLGYDAGLHKRVGYAYDLAKSKQLLEEAGWKVGSDGVRVKDGVRLELKHYTDWAGIIPASQAVQGMLKEVGIKADLVNLEGAAAKQALDRGEHNLFIQSLTSNDPDVLYRVFHSTSIGNWNLCHVKNPDLDALLDKGNTEVDPAKRAPIYVQIQEITLKEAYSVPMYNTMRIFAAHPYVKDIKWTDRAWPISYQVWLDK